MTIKTDPAAAQAVAILGRISAEIQRKGIPSASLAEAIGVTARAIDKWRAIRAFPDNADGPGLILVLRALHRLGWTLRPVKLDEAKAAPVAAPSPPQRAHRLEVYAERGPWGLTKLYEFVKRGMLPARKIDGTTFVLESDWNAFLTGAPLALDVRRKAD